MQSLENYADDSSMPYWKFKGGETVLICGVDKEANAVALAALLHADQSFGYIEFPSSWEVVPDDFVPITGRENYTYEAFKSGRFVQRVLDNEGNDINDMDDEVEHIFHHSKSCDACTESNSSISTPCQCLSCDPDGTRYICSCEEPEEVDINYVSTILKPTVATNPEYYVTITYISANGLPGFNPVLMGPEGPEKSGNTYAPTDVGLAITHGISWAKCEDIPFKYGDIYKPAPSSV
jgi:hypothetical protein